MLDVENVNVKFSFYQNKSVCNKKVFYTALHTHTEDSELACQNSARQMKKEKEAYGNFIFHFPSHSLHALNVHHRDTFGILIKPNYTKLVDRKHNKRKWPSSGWNELRFVIDGPQPFTTSFTTTNHVLSH